MKKLFKIPFIQSLLELLCIFALCLAFCFIISGLSSCDQQLKKDKVQTVNIDGIKVHFTQWHSYTSVSYRFAKYNQSKTIQMQVMYDGIVDCMALLVIDRMRYSFTETSCNGLNIAELPLYACLDVTRDSVFYIDNIRESLTIPVPKTLIDELIELIAK